ncbi:ABC transporter ATP-binding protein [Thermoflavimicrobium dichotomicum]|uniref:ATP-binding cassette, subfamily B/ATP-binding cassette, subfamily B, MsbA n=1 Tax=Thermoflavimicrobium dichotomicum TaxID=46223 RepID=A0A1I3TF68_9BACL|nr:ABC transporter ATP-binding protein [Thermoflavimicrobium dichotomicum]SFJ69818.1 ATP-binding cassette, subfamily B/ATP-binding cassette, subfamily B, MsbA [Thermoflavimicrobium dichotomicum]
MEQKVKLNLFRIIWDHKNVLMIGLLIMLISTALNLINPWIMKLMIDDAIPKAKVELLVYCIVGVVGIPVINVFLSSYQSLYQSDVNAKIIADLRNQLVVKLTKLSQKTMVQFRQGDISGRIIRTCSEIAFFITGSLMSSFSNILRLVGIFFMIFYLNFQLSIISLMLVPIILYLSRIWKKKIREASEKICDSRKRYDEYIAELVTGIKTVQMFHKEEDEIKQAKNLNAEYRDLRRVIQRQQMLIGNIIWSIYDSISIGVLYAFGAWMIFRGQLTTGELIAFTIYVPQLYSSMSAIVNLYLRKNEVKPEIERYDEMMNLPEENIDQDHAVSLQEVKGKIEFKQVSFGYQEDHENLKQVSFTIHPGEFIGIVGPTGGGKSTILDLIMRFYHPREGEILLDDVPIQQVKLEDLRSEVSLVSQDPFLWNRSIKENLLYVAPMCTEQEIDESIQIAQMENMIRKMPDGLDTIIGDRGVRLSGGEKQRLAIARALLRKPSILLLDEPTSALDAKTESLLQKYLEKVYKGKTVIVVAHRLATIRQADRILVVADGMIQEMGSHQELLEQRGMYYELYKEQMGALELEKSSI